MLYLICFFEDNSERCEQTSLALGGALGLWDDQVIRFKAHPDDDSASSYSVFEWLGMMMIFFMKIKFLRLWHLRVASQVSNFKKYHL